MHIISYVYTIHKKALNENWKTTDNWKNSIKYVSIFFNYFL